MREILPGGELPEPAKLLGGEPVDPRVEPEAWDSIHRANDAFGQCDFPNYCKFYGTNPGFCDRAAAKKSGIKSNQAVSIRSAPPERII